MAHRLCPVSGKRKYQSRGDAFGWASDYVKHPDAPAQLFAYRCSHCGAWHLTKRRNANGTIKV